MLVSQKKSSWWLVCDFQVGLEKRKLQLGVYLVFRAKSKFILWLSLHTCSRQLQQYLELHGGYCRMAHEISQWSVLAVAAAKLGLPLWSRAYVPKCADRIQKNLCLSTFMCACDCFSVIYACDCFSVIYVWDALFVQESVYLYEWADTLRNIIPAEPTPLI